MLVCEHCMSYLVSQGVVEYCTPAVYSECDIEEDGTVWSPSKGFFVPSCKWCGSTLEECEELYEVVLK